MTDPAASPPGDPLQFDAAVPRDGRRASATCAQCHAAIRTNYWEANGQVLCSSCKTALDAVHGPTARAGAGPMLRAALFGVGAALAGAAIYLAVAYFLNLEVGLIAILVGFMVGWAVRKGTRDRGGRRFQVLAVVLTYLAISVTYVPQMLMSSADTPAPPARTDSAAAVGASDSAVAAGVGDSAGPVAASANADIPPRSIALLVVGVLVLLVIAPVKVVVTQLPGSLITALIVGFGLMQAWKLPARQVITFRGPFRLASPADDRTPSPPA